MIVLGGPTAVGKTAVALELVSRMPGQFEVVSADSIQVYRRLDIGSAKPTIQERTLARFHMVDIVDPSDEFTLAHYQAAAGDCITGILARGCIPLVVGGTGLYIRSLASRLDIPSTAPDEELRARLRQIALDQGRAALHEQLKAIDPETADRVHENDSNRIVRAIEVYEKTGKPISEWRRLNEVAATGDSNNNLYVGLDMDRAHLYRRIEQRVDTMLTAGFVDEVRRLREDGISPLLKPMQSVGYRQINLFLDAVLSLEDAVADIKVASRQYARRQLIWFRAVPGITWISTDTQSGSQIATQILRMLEKRL